MKNLLCMILIFISAAVAFGQDISERYPYEQVIEDFRQAILDNNKEEAARLLVEDARILEGGNIENTDEYLSHHFSTDGKFLRAMEMKMLGRTMRRTGVMAWISTKTQMKGTYNGRKIDLISLELAVLKKAGDSWKIAAVHWSSTSNN